MATSRVRIQAAIGCVLFLAGLLWFWSVESLILFGSKTEGTVIQNIAQGRGYAAEIVFHPTPESTEHFVTTSSYNPPLYTPGERVTVYFDVQNPERATAGSFFSSLFGPCMVAAAGIVNIFLASIQYRRRSASDENG